MMCQGGEITKKKLYVIGLDSTPPWIIEKMIKKYHMAGFQLFKIKKMESTVPPISNPAWVTIYTGLLPDQHKIIDFTTINKDYGRTLQEIDDAKTPPFWDILAQRNLKSLVITPVVIFEPSRYDNVDMITGFPDDTKYSSKRIADTCSTHNFKGEPDILNQLNRGKLPIKNGCDIYASAASCRAATAMDLIRTNDYDLVFICFSEIDRAIHYVLNLEDWDEYLAPMYKEVSDFLLWLDKRIKQNNEDATVMLISDHGAQPIRTIFLSNSWLISKGYATPKDEVAKRHIPASTDPSAPSFKNKLIDAIAESNLRRTIYKAMPRPIQKLGEDLRESSQDYETGGQYLRIKEIDLEMQQTKAFASVTHSHLVFIWINDERFNSPYGYPRDIPKHFKTWDDYVLTSLTKDLMKEDFIQSVYLADKYYHSSDNFIAPNLIAELNPGFYGEYQGYAKDKWLVKPSISGGGGHTMDGLIAIKSYRGNNAPELKINEVSDFIIRYFNG